MESSAELMQPLSVPLPSEVPLLQTLKQITDDFIEPRAEAVDQGKGSVGENLDAMAKVGLVGVTTPVEYGGKGASGAFQREFTEILTAACGTTWFVLTQHLGACGMLAGSENPTLRERYLSDMASGSHYVGVGFGHLRRPQTMLTARRVEDGYLLNGVAPWVTGWPLLSGVVFGATLEDNRHVYLYSSTQEGDTLSSTAPLPLCAMNATATTEVTLRNHFVPERDWIKFGSREQMAEGDRLGIAGAVHPALGCARGSLRTLQRTAEQRKIPAMAAAAEALEREIASCRQNARIWAEFDKTAPEYEAGALQVRAWAIELAVRAAHMSVTAGSGGANSLDHPAQRRFREAMFYTLTAQTGAILTATLERLTQR